MSLGRECVFVKSKSRRSPRFATKRQLTCVLLTDSASQSNASKGRPPDTRQEFGFSLRCCQCARCYFGKEWLRSCRLPKSLAF